MKNLSNINYNPTKVYSNSKQSEPDTSSDKLYPDTKNPTKSDEPTNNLISIGFTYMIKDSDFDSLYSPCIAIKQTRVVIWNKPMIKVDDKLDKVYIDFWEPYYPISIVGKTYTTILLDTKIQKT